MMTFSSSVPNVARALVSSGQLVKSNSVETAFRMPVTEAVGEAKLDVVKDVIIGAGPVDLNPLPVGSSPNFGQEPLQPWAWVCLHYMNKH